MKNIFYTLGIAFVLIMGVGANAQNVNNPGFESWETTTPELNEPTDWNSFKTASGAWSSFGGQQLDRSTQKRPGSTGNYSAVIWCRNAGPAMANGNLTTGQINMGSTVPSNSNNYNVSHTTNAAFSEAFGGHPDSLVVWVRSKISDTSHQPRIHAVIHDTYDYRDPNGSDANAANHIVAEATLNFTTTNNQWIRESIPFIYSGPASSPDYILISFTTCKDAGVGTEGDSLYIDDIEMIYTGASIKENVSTDLISVFTDIKSQQLVIKMDYPQLSNTTITIYDLVGQKVYQTEKELCAAMEYVDISGLNPGVYIVDINRKEGTRFTRKFTVN